MIWWVFLLLLSAARGLPSQELEGEVRLVVRDPSGAALMAQVKLSSLVTPGAVWESRADYGGRWRARHLPFGAYSLEVSRAGFAPYRGQIDIRSAIPQVREVTLALESMETSIHVVDSASLVDPRQAGTVYQVDHRRLEELPFSTPGRGAAGVLSSLPGWVLEANAVLHPRGSEYDTQYVIDGMPLTDNRSPAYAPPVELDNVEAVNVMTAGIPAEYGRKLGGIVELFTRRNDRPGHHPEIALRGGSFESAESYASDSFVSGRTAFSAGVRFGTTARFLDPPEIENYTDHGAIAGATLRIERDLSPRDRLDATLQSGSANFLVPNDLAQQQNGQRQDRRNAETAGRVSFQHVFSSNSVANVRAMVRDLSARLWSNPLAVPVQAAQDRGFREAYLAASFSVQKGSHLVKFGVDGQTAGVHESFSYQDPGQPDSPLQGLAADGPQGEAAAAAVAAHAFQLQSRRGVLSAAAGADAVQMFQFHDRRRSGEAGAFVEDHWLLGPWTFNAGLRWDYYGLLVHETAWSPRLGVAYRWSRPDLVLHASYDRAFQTPAIENILLTGAFQGLPVRPSRANFYEVGVRKGFGRILRVDVNQFWRRFSEFADDDVFLNTGISFPIAFSRAHIHGTEVRVDVPGGRGISGFASWSNQAGIGYLPLTGGLFLGQDATNAIQGTGNFPITQDQRNTVRAQVRWEFHPRLWASLGSQYASGLPVELDPGEGPADFPNVSPRILERVNFARGRVRPAFRLDLSAGAELWRRERRSIRFQVDLLNATNRLNLINFSGLLSGTAIAAPRTVGAQLRLQF